MQPQYEGAINPLPPAVTALAVLIAGIQLLFEAGERGIIGGPEAVGWRLAALRDWGMFDPLVNWMLENHTILWSELVRLLTYPLIHLGFTHALFAVVFVLAIGKQVAEAMGQLAFLAIFFVSAAGGALIWALLVDERQVLAGAFPGVYGLIGAYTFILWLVLDRIGENRWRAFSLIGFLLGIQLIFNALFGGNLQWVADVGGFVVGFVFAWATSPVGRARFREWLMELRRR